MFLHIPPDVFQIPPRIFDIVEFLSCNVTGGVGLCDCPVALYIAMTHKWHSFSSSLAYNMLSPSRTALKKNLPPSKSKTKKEIYIFHVINIRNIENEKYITPDLI